MKPESSALPNDNLDRAPFLQEHELRESAWRQAVVDASRLRGSRGFWLLEASSGVVGALIGALAPSNASTGQSIVFAVLGATVGGLGAGLLVLGWCLLRAPFRQRDAARVELLALASASLIAEPAVVVRQSDNVSFESPRPYNSWATIRVYNAQQRGGERAEAKHVSPEIVIRSGKNELFRWKGWDTGAWRDFTTAQEEHALWIAVKLRSEADYAALEGRRDRRGPTLSEPELDVCLTLRGYNIEPMVETFRLSSRGSGHDLKIEKA